MGLVHYPVYNKNHDRIASALTTIDLHDMARLSRTYGVKSFFVVTPLKDQQQLAERVIKHWTRGYGAVYNRHRKEAMELVRVVPSIQSTIEEVRKLEGQPPILIATDASEQQGRTISFQALRRMLHHDEKAVLLFFGTAWGLDDTFMNRTDRVLDPIVGRTEYNHLSVRSAAAIILDRLAGARQES